MRINYSEDEDYPGQFELWQANCKRSLCGKMGQEELRQLRDALLSMPEKRLIHGALVNSNGEVCAIGAYARHKGLDLQKFNREDDTDEVGVAAGMPRLVAWKVVEMNDMELGEYAPESITPELRYVKMLEWVESKSERGRPHTEHSLKGTICADQRIRAAQAFCAAPKPALREGRAVKSWGRVADSIFAALIWDMKSDTFDQGRDDQIGDQMEAAEQRDMQDVVFLPEEDQSLSASGQELTVSRQTIKQLLDDNSDMRVILPDDMPVNGYWNFLTATCHVYQITQATNIRLRKAVGRMMQMADENPEFYRAHGFEKYSDFVRSLEKAGLKHTTAYQARKIFEAFPNLPASEWDDSAGGIGVKKLECLASFTNEKISDHKDHIEAARNLTESELVGYAEQKGLANRGQLVGCVITIPATVEIRDIWEEHRNDERVQKLCASNRASEILVHTIQEASSSWGAHPLPMLVLSPDVRDAIEQFCDDSRVQKAAGTADKNVLVMWGLARCLNGLK